MRRLGTTLVFLLFLSNSVLGQTIVITHAKAYSVPGTPPIHDATILIRDGHIARIGTGVRLADGARTIDAKGKIVTPGLMNSGTELGLVESGSDDTTDHGVTSGPFGPAFDIQYALNSNSTLLSLARTDGLTRAVTIPSSSAVPPFSGLGAVLRLSEGEDILDCARAAMFATVGGMSSSQVGGSRSAQWLLISNALDEANRYAEQVKAGKSGNLSEHGYLLTRINLEALLPVIEGNIPFAITARRESDIRQAIRLAEDYKLRVIIVGGDEAWRVAPDLATRKIPVVLDPFASTPTTFDQIGARLENAALLQRAGVKISFSVPGVHMSHNAGLVIREGAGIAVANGLPWDEALRAITLSPAETWGIDDHYGTLEAGKDADLVIWSGDPLEPMSSAEIVFIRGHQVSLKNRQNELQDRYSPKRKNDPWPPQYK